MLFFQLIAEVGPARATVITYVNPAVAVALGVGVLGEPLTPEIIAAFGLILAGSVLATRSGQPAGAGGEGTAGGAHAGVTVWPAVSVWPVVSVWPAVRVWPVVTMAVSAAMSLRRTGSPASPATGPPRSPATP